MARMVTETMVDIAFSPMCIVPAGIGAAIAAGGADLMVADLVTRFIPRGTMNKAVTAGAIVYASCAIGGWASKRLFAFE